VPLLEATTDLVGEGDGYLVLLLTAENTSVVRSKPSDYGSPTRANRSCLIELG
jgi:hypothetical protein